MRLPLEKTQLSVVSARRARIYIGTRECRQMLILPEGIICYTFTFTYIN